MIIDHGARFDISYEMLVKFFQLPEGAIIERVHIREDIPKTISVIVQHDDLPEVNWGEYYQLMAPTYTVCKCCDAPVLLSWGEFSSGVWMRGDTP